MKKTMYLAVLLWTMYSCGSKDHNNSNTEQSHSVLSSIMSGELLSYTEVPFPLAGCKELFRKEQAHNSSKIAELKRLYSTLPEVTSELLNQGFEQYFIDYREGIQWTINFKRKEMEELPPTDSQSRAELRSEIDFLHSQIKKEVALNLYRGARISEYEAKIRTQSSEIQKIITNIFGHDPSPLGHYFQDQQTDNYDLRFLSPCSKAIDDLLRSVWSESYTDFYTEVSRYFEPRRIKGQNIALTSFLQAGLRAHVSYSLEGFSNLPEYVSLENTDVRVHKNSFISTYLYRDMTEYIELNHNYFNFLRTIPAQNDNSLFSERDRIILSRSTLHSQQSGYPYNWEEKSSFDHSWENLFAKLSKKLSSCNLIFEKGSKDIFPDTLPEACLAEGVPLTYRGSVKTSLLISLSLLDMAGIAYSERDDDSARELLDMAKEVFKFSLDLAVGLSPAGRAKDITEALSGYSIIPPDFDHLSPAERVVSALGAVTIGTPTLKILVKYIVKSKVLKKISAVESGAITKKMLKEADAVLDEIKTRLPRSGTWTGERGKSFWKSDNNLVNEITRGERVPYRNYFPDFSKWSKGEKKFTGLTGHNSNDFPMVYQWIKDEEGLASLSEAKAFLARNQLTIHHVEDGVTVQLVPSKLHNNTPHLGGAALIKRVRKHL